LKPLLGATAISIEASDEQLVEWAQTGSSEAFAVLFRRYRPAIGRYAGRILGDDARAEDIVQEVFLSALRNIGTLDRPAGFKPWLYRIAHNTCVDHMRRNRRAEEVSIDANLLPPSEEIRLFRKGPSTHAAVAQKEDVKNLREAFGGLPPAQSEVLVMRELEGLSYDEIALRLGVTRASVESTLFRARQGLRDEYGEIATGERCLRMRPVIARLAEGMGGLRDRRALARHVRGCQPCRRDAWAMGLGGSALEAPATGIRGGLSRVASLLPLPWLIHRRADGADPASSAGAGGGSFATQAQTAMTNLSSSVGIGADQAATAIHKAVAVVAAVAVVGGSGYVASKSSTDGDLLLKSDRDTVPARADVGPVVPPGLGPLKPTRSAAGNPAAVAAAPTGPTESAAANTTPLLPTDPSGVPGPIETLGVPEAVAAPAHPEEQAAGGESPSGTAPDSTSGTDNTIPAAGDTGPADTGTGGGGSGTGTGGGGGSGGSGGDGGGSGGDGGGTSPTDPPLGGSTPPGGSDENPSCDLPPGLDKKDKLPPGWVKKCVLESAETAPSLSTGSSA
jgi:RNA polymerase sigma factor (sigma-70 family)